MSIQPRPAWAVIATAAATGLWLLASGVALGQSDWSRDVQAVEAKLQEDDAAGGAALSPEWRALRRANHLFQRACLTETLPDLREARAALAALPLSPEHPGIALARARIALDLHSLPDARNALSAADDDLGEAELNGLIFDFALQDGRYAEARQLAAQWDGEDSRGEDLCRVASLAAFAGDDARADRLLARAEAQLTVKEMRLFAWIAMQRGLLRFRVGDFAGARQQYARAEKAYSGWWRVKEREAELLGAERRFDESETLYREILAAQPRPEIEQELADLLAFRGKGSEAVEHYQRALAAFLDSAQRGEMIYLHHLVSLYGDGLGNPAEALRWARVDVAARGNASARDALAWASYLAGDLSAAQQEMSTALATGVQEPHILAHAAMILVREGRRGEAQKLYKNPAVSKFLFNATFHAHR